MAARDDQTAGAEWREGNHDDLMLALALWRGDRPRPRYYIV